MIQNLLLGVWVCLATLGGVYGAQFLSMDAPADNAVKVGSLSYVTTNPMSVPLIDDGELHGYAIVKLIYAVREKKLAANQERIAAHFRDAANRVLYAEEAKLLISKRKHDMGNLAVSVKAAVNTSLQTDLVEEVLFEQFNYVSRDQVRCVKRQAGSSGNAGEAADAPLRKGETAATGSEADDHSAPATGRAETDQAATQEEGAH